jgi:hypothetical protein
VTQNRGFEASSYLSYIVNNYDKLPERCVVIVYPPGQIA